MFVTLSGSDLKAELTQLGPPSSADSRARLSASNLAARQPSVTTAPLRAILHRNYLAILPIIARHNCTANLANISNSKMEVFLSEYLFRPYPLANRDHPNCIADVSQKYSNNSRDPVGF